MSVLRFIAIVPFLLAALTPAQAQIRYDEEYPVIDYSNAELDNPVIDLLRDVEAGKVHLEWKPERGYLDSLLEALGINPDSQSLVFSKTSLKARFITAATPRALYFNDDVYVGFTQGASALEIAVMDPNLGPVFFDMPNRAGEEVDFERQMGRCLRCHDSYGLTGGGVPRFILSSNLADEEGTLVTHELSEITSTATPIRRRWGGLYVSGTHGDMEHMGNVVLREVQPIIQLDLSLTGNKTDLGEFVDLSPYPSEHSDIVPLLVMEHQVELQNLLTRVNYDARTLLDGQAMDDAVRARLAEITEPLVRSLLMADEAPLTSAVHGSSSFAEHFQSLGPFDARGRSLRELQLETRTFRYPLSYLVYSDAFLALPDEVKGLIYGRLRDILAGRDTGFPHLDADTRGAIQGILRDTHAEYAAFLEGSAPLH